MFDWRRKGATFKVRMEQKSLNKTRGRPELKGPFLLVSNKKKVKEPKS